MTEKPGDAPRPERPEEDPMPFSSDPVPPAEESPEPAEPAEPPPLPPDDATRTPPHPPGPIPTPGQQPPPHQPPPQQAPPPPQQAPPPPAWAPPQAAPPPGYQAPPGYPPPGQAPPPHPGYGHPPGHQAPPGYPPPGQPPPPAWVPPAPPAPIPKGPHNQPIFGGRECASWGRRVGAILLDWLIAYLPPIVVGGGLLAVGSTGTDIAGGVILGLGLLFAYVFYAPVFMVRGGERNGQTLGKQICDIRVVRDNDEQFGFGAALLREFVVRQLLFGVIGGIFFGLAQLLDYLWPLWDDTNRTLHDMIVSTHVVYADQPAGPMNAG